MFPAGHFGRIDIHNKELVLEKYWDFNFQSDSNETDISEYEEELDRLLRQAVSRQLLSDVEIGSYLSGGMDSGTLTALASRELPYIKTFTCGFDLSSAAGIELGFDERIKAEAMSSLFKTEHYEMVLKSGDMERCLDHVVRQIEEPRVGQSYPNYYVAQLASKFVKVVLSGAGGDELFGGYPWRYFRSIGVSDFNTFVDDYYGYWNRLMTSGELKRLFAPIWNDVRSVDTKQIFSNVFSTSNNLLNEPRDYINHSLYFEAKTFLHGLFVVEDKLSMAHGLETRVPFMDNDLVDFAMSCPLELKIKNFGQVPKINENDAGNKSDRYFQKTNDGKNILRSVMASYIPASITNAQKKGFSSPDASWFKGESIDFVKARLLLKTSPIYELVDYKSVNDLLEAHFQGKSNRRLLIWSLLSLDSLLREEII
jgi:asparagine synthase (glutamine-hydrolysing)